MSIYKKVNSWGMKFDFDYRFDVKQKQGVITSGNESVTLTGEISRRINALLYYNESQKYNQLRKGSNCIISASYIAGENNNIGKGDSDEGVSWSQGAYDVTGEIIGGKYETPQQAMKALGDKLICRFTGKDGGLSHSVIICGAAESGRIFGFEQRGFGSKWGFCDVDESFRFYKAQDCYYLPIEN